MSKSLDIEIISRRYVQINSIVSSGAIDVENAAAATLYINYCQVVNDDHIAVPPTFLIEAKHSTFWATIASWQPGRVSPANAEIIDSTPVESTALTFDSIPTIWESGDFYFIQHRIIAEPNNLSKCEFIRGGYIDTSTKQVALLDGTMYDHTTVGETEVAYLYNAYNHMIQIDLKSVANIRLIVDATSCDKIFATEVRASILD